MKNQKKRFSRILYIYALLFLFLISGLIYLQCINGEEFKNKLESRESDTYSGSAARGSILDRYGRVLVCDEPSADGGYKRVYYNGAFASHIIGTVGRINEREYKSLKTMGYDINDIVGKQGVELLAEEYLRGDKSDGLSEPYGGDDVVLTIDIELQAVLENSLERTIRQISENGSLKNGEDADSGAAVVVDVRSGEILACASYPTYDISEYYKTYEYLVSDPALPLWNRAVSGVYSPGSTFKPLVAVAALADGAISPDEMIEDKGIYREYDDYRPRCWIWSEQGKTHGFINVTDAIEKSCNYFFYEAGKRTGIDVISEFASKFGLGSLTGTGLVEEAAGIVANPLNKRKIFRNENAGNWYGADTLQASIGQSVNSFTPLQLASYIATLANGGTRYKLNIVKRIHSGPDGDCVIEFSPDVLNTINIDKLYLDAVLQGMKNVAEEGSAKGIFSGYPVSVGGKTGTVQVGSNSSNNAVFTAFAPFDNPEIAVCVVIEHGVRGVNAAYVAKDLFDYYFELNDEISDGLNVDLN